MKHREEWDQETLWEPRGCIWIRNRLPFHLILLTIRLGLELHKTRMVLWINKIFHSNMIQTLIKWTRLLAHDSLKAILGVGKSYNNKDKKSKNCLNSSKWVFLEGQAIEVTPRLIWMNQKIYKLNNSYNKMTILVKMHHQIWVLTGCHPEGWWGEWVDKMLHHIMATATQYKWANKWCHLKTDQWL